MGGEIASFRLVRHASRAIGRCFGGRVVVDLTDGNRVAVVEPSWSIYAKHAGNDE
jgi:hypothetical protein